MGQTLTVTSPDVAEVLADPEQWRMLATFATQERSLSEAAKILDLKLPALTYHVKKWLELDLLKITREEQRQGRAVKYYRATGERFFIPFALTKSETLADLLGALVKPAHETALRETAHALQTRSENWGLLFYSSGDANGTRFSATLVTSAEAHKDLDEVMLEPDQPALYESFSNLKLEFETAKQLQRDLENLYNEYLTQQIDGQQEYLLRLGITPLRAGTKII